MYLLNKRIRILLVKRAFLFNRPFVFSKKLGTKGLYSNNKIRQTITNNIKRRIKMQKAEVGNIIEFKNGLRGIVEKVNENSVIVDLTYMENYKELDLQERTVVNHKNYKIIK
jgi:uncharacterized protein YkvS